MLSTLLRHTPAQCPFCARWPVWGGPAGVCGDCLARFAAPQVRCPRCALRVAVNADGQASPCPACARLPAGQGLDACVAAVDYAYPWHGAIGQFKYQRAVHWAYGFGALMANAPGSAALLEAADLIAPVPLTAARLSWRGFNQAWELARQTVRQTVLQTDAPSLRHKLRADLLLRTRDVPAQVQTGSRKARQRNLRAAFALRDASDVAGRHVLLIDDVMTTGATLYALTTLLRQHGAAQVSALVFARTPLGG